MKTIAPEEAAKLVKSGAVLIDIRETPEHAGENIPGARHCALSQIDEQHPARAGDTVLIFHCKSGARTNMHAERLAATAGNCEVYLLSGGIEAWKRAGLPTARQSAGKTEAGKGKSGGGQGGLLSRLTSLFR